MLFAMSSEEYLMVESIILRWCFITPIGRCEWMSRMSIVEICAYSARTAAEGNVLSATPCRYCCPSSDHLQAKTNGPYFSSQAASLFHGSAAAISCFGTSSFCSILCPCSGSAAGILSGTSASVRQPVTVYR